MGRRGFLAVPAGAAVIATAWLSTGPPRITLLNASVVVDYPWSRGVAAIACAAGIALLGALLRRPALRGVGFVLALGSLLVGAHLILYRLEASASAIATRGVLGTTTIGWKAVSGVELAATDVLVHGEGGTTISVDTADFAPEQRAMLERTVARHVRESGGSGVATVP
jgi:hypothetical protein